MQGGVCGMCRAAGIPCELMVRQTNRRSKCGCLGEFLGSIYFRAAFEFLRSTLATEGKTSFEKKEAIHLGFFFLVSQTAYMGASELGKIMFKPP